MRPTRRSALPTKSLRVRPNKEKRSADNKAWREANKAHALSASKERSKAYYKANKAAYVAKDAARRATKLSATPPWQSREELDAIYLDRPEGSRKWTTYAH